jgi:hypothetical protein
MPGKNTSGIAEAVFPDGIRSGMYFLHVISGKTEEKIQVIKIE